MAEKKNITAVQVIIIQVSGTEESANALSYHKECRLPRELNDLLPT